MGNPKFCWKEKPKVVLDPRAVQLTEKLQMCQLSHTMKAIANDEEVKCKSLLVGFITNGAYK